MFKIKVSRRSFLAMAAMSTAACTMDYNKIKHFAFRMGPKKDYPTVIIGAGIGGLCCGAYLARQGIPVTVVEQHMIPGGYATAFKRGAFNFDVSLHGTSIRNNATEDILRDVGVLEKIDLVELPELYCLKSPSGEIESVPQRDPDAYIAVLARHFPNEEKGIRGFVEEMVDIADESGRIMKENPTVRGLLYKMTFPKRYPKMWRVRNKTLADMLDEYIKNPVLKDYLSALWGYYGLPPSRLSAFMYSVATGDYIKNGSYYVRKRSQDLSNELAAMIENNGGRIIYGDSVEKIVLADGAVSSVELAKGASLPARAVVSNASAITTFNKMLPEGALPDSYMGKIRTYRPSLSSFIVWLGLKEELRGKIKGAHIYTSGGQDPEKNYESIVKGEVEKISYGLSIYDNVYEGYSDPGTSTVMITVLSGYEPWRRFEADYKAGNKDEYYKEKQRWTEMLIKRAEQEVIPGLSSMIEVKEAATPLTNWRFTRNTEGAIYGFEQSLENAYMNRIDNRTPVKGLYLASAWGNPSGGFTGVLMSGQQTFLKMMEDWAG